MPDEDLVNALAQYLEFEPMEKLALLERHGAAGALPIDGRAAGDEGADEETATPEESTRSHRQYSHGSAENTGNTETPSHLNN